MTAFVTNHDALSTEQPKQVSILISKILRELRKQEYLRAEILTLAQR